MNGANSSESNEPIAGGNGSEGSNQNSSNGGSNPPPKENVLYETHRKLLDEKKKVQQERDQLRAEKEERERKEMEQKGEWQKVIELEKKRAEEASAKLQEYENRFTQAKKMGALLKALDNSVDEKFFDFLPVDQIVTDPESGEINLNSVAEVADNFRKAYPELLKPKNGPRLPNGAPVQNSPSQITESDWNKLPASEMKKWKYNQIIWEK